MQLAGDKYTRPWNLQKKATNQRLGSSRPQRPKRTQPMVLGCLNRRWLDATRGLSNRHVSPTDNQSIITSLWFFLPSTTPIQFPPHAIPTLAFWLLSVGPLISSVSVHRLSCSLELINLFLSLSRKEEEEVAPLIRWWRRRRRCQIRSSTSTALSPPDTFVLLSPGW